MKIYLCVCVCFNNGCLTTKAFLIRDKAEEWLKEVIESSDFRMNYNEAYLEELEVIE